jgi:hypothetical protein
MDNEPSGWTTEESTVAPVASTTVSLEPTGNPEAGQYIPLELSAVQGGK